MRSAHRRGDAEVELFCIEVGLPGKTLAQRVESKHLRLHASQPQREGVKIVAGGFPCSIDVVLLPFHQPLQGIDVGKLSVGLGIETDTEAPIENGAAQYAQCQQGKLQGTFRIDFEAANLTDTVSEHDDIQCAFHYCCRNFAKPGLPVCLLSGG